MKWSLSAGSIVLCAGLALTSLLAKAGDQADVEMQRISFTKQIIPVLRIRCAVCHMTGTEPGSLRLFPAAAYDSLVGVKSAATGKLLVSSSRPDDSYLLHKIRGTHLDVGGEGSRMPHGQEPLSQEVISLVEMWIEQGAERN